jgi:hypothetical protein
MAATINTAFINQFSDVLHDQVEQKESRLRSTVSVEMAKGENHFFDRLDSFTATEITGRLATTDLQDPAHSRRMATIRKYAANTYFDDLDKIKMLLDPTSDYTRKLAAAHGRQLDTIIQSAMTGAASTGKDGSGSQVFDTSNNQIAHGSAGLTVAKLNQALRILQSNEVDIQGRLYLATKSLGLEDLLGDSSNQITSFDYQDGKVLSDGKFPSFRGVNIVHCERIADETAATTYRGLLYTPDSIKLAMAKDVTVDSGKRLDLNNVMQITTSMAYGAVRMEEETIVDILYQ